MFFTRPARVVSSFALLIAPSLARAQRPIPVRALGPIEARSKDTVGFVRGVRELPGGRLIANDPDNRRLLLFDASFATFRTIADTTSGSGTPYGARPSTIIPFTGDSTLFVDVYSRGFVVVAPSGSMSRTIAAPRTEDVPWLANAYGQPGFDATGRIIYRGYPAYRERDESQSLAARPDSAPIVRADFDTRKADTIGLVAIPSRRASTTKLPDGRSMMQLMVNPLTFTDDWAVLPDGSVAILRGQDYHIDWINADGTRTSSPKMPFDWKRLTDADKQAIVDSAKKAVAQQWTAQNAPGPNGAPPAAAAGGASAGVSRVGSSTDDASPRPAPPPPPRVMPEVVPISDLPDYVPPVLRSGTMRADPDGNVWILPSTSSQSAGGLLYDVVNRKGEIVERVRVPDGRAVAGFGANGAVYMTAHDSTGTRIERARLRRE